jgi:LPS-assembly lipoprotein
LYRLWLLLVILLAGCGFQLRGDAPMGLKTLLVSSDAPSQVAVDIRRTLAGSATRVVKDAKEAEASLKVLTEVREKNIFTITGAGRVYEYQLRLIVTYQLTMPGKDDPVIPPSQIELRRLITYSESAPVAKEAEEQLLYRDMVADAAAQILRRIAIVRRAA